MPIKFTLFIPPNGRRESITIDRPSDIEDAAERLTDAGCRFEAEVLRNGMVSLECMAPGGVDVDGSLAIELVPNGPGVPDAVDRVVSEATKAFAEKDGLA